jgi:hypothetical protein
MIDSIANSEKTSCVRMYVDENGHQELKGDLSNPSKRFLCLTGIIMRISDHPQLTSDLNTIKIKYFGSPDIILHRREIISACPPFSALSDPAIRENFNQDILCLIEKTDFRIISVLIDKKVLFDMFGFKAQDPYALALEYLMQRYQYWLQDYCKNKSMCYGDILAESRGGSEDITTKNTYQQIYEGKGYNPLKDADIYYSSCEIKLKPKKKNIAGLQFVDLLAHPARRYILTRYNLATNLKQSSYEQRIVDILVKSKFRRNKISKSIDGYGIAIYPCPTVKKLAR